MKKELQTFVLSTLAMGHIVTSPLSVLANSDVYIATSIQSSNPNAPHEDQASSTINNILVATVATNLQFDIGQNKPQKINLILAQPFNNFPTGSYLKATIKPTEDGNAILIAEALYGNNQMLKINAESEIIYGQTVTVSNRAQEATKRTAATAPLGGLLGTALGEDVESIIQFTAIAGSIGYTTGLLSPQKIQLLNLAAGTPIFFSVKSN